MAGRARALFEHIAEKIADRTEIPDIFFAKEHDKKFKYTFHHDGVDWKIRTGGGSSAIHILGNGPYQGNGYYLSTTVARNTTMFTFFIVDPADAAEINRECAVRCIKELDEKGVFLVQLLAQEPKPST